MIDKSQIIHLIQQDLKHSQLTEALRNLGLDDGGLYSLDLMTIVAEFTEVQPAKMERFAEIYGCYLDEAIKYPITNLGEHLLPLAKDCHEQLLGCMYNY